MTELEEERQLTKDIEYLSTTIPDEPDMLRDLMLMKQDNIIRKIWTLNVLVLMFFKCFFMYFI
jgi:hypothetical protein